MAKKELPDFIKAKMGAKGKEALDTAMKNKKGKDEEKDEEEKDEDEDENEEEETSEEGEEKKGLMASVARKVKKAKK